MKREEAKIILECMATDIIGAMTGMRETMPMLDVLRQRVDAINIALTALTQPTQEQLEKVWRGKWIHAMPILGSGDEEIRCSECGNIIGFITNFCPYCGAPMTDEAVEMVMERLEKIVENRTD